MSKLFIPLLLFSTIIFAADNHFKYIKPIDSGINYLLKWENTERATKYSDYTLWATVVTPYLYALKEKDQTRERITTIVSVQVMSALLSDLVKLRSNRTRPNVHDKRSFYSGHTSAAFTSAGLVCMQTSEKKYCYTALGMASLTGYLRMAGNWHWFSDVFVGATVGFFNGRYIPTLIMSF